MQHFCDNSTVKRDSASQASAENTQTGMTPSNFKHYYLHVLFLGY